MARSKRDPRQKEFDFEDATPAKHIDEMTADEIIALGKEIDDLPGVDVLQRAIESGLTTQKEEEDSWNYHRNRYVLTAKDEQSFDTGHPQWRYGGKKHLEHVEKMQKGKFLHRIVRLLEQRGVPGAAEALESMTAELHYQIYDRLQNKGDVA